MHATAPKPEELLTRLFGDGVASAWRDPREPVDPAWPEEEAQIRDAAPQRRHEFRTGRAVAHAALRRLGVASAPLLVGPGRAPLWPPGVVGSITHGETFCAAVVAWQSDYVGLGVDVETDQPVSDAFAARVCSPRELARCAELGDIPTLARVVFSAKESVYKFQFPLTQSVLYWRDLDVTLNPDNFQARLLSACPPFRTEQVLVGRWQRELGVILSGVSLKQGSGNLES